METNVVRSNKSARNHREATMSKAKGKSNSDAQFKTGDIVRVRHGVRDTDYPDMPLGGWTGEIVEVHDDLMYMIKWNKNTLASIHTVFKARCERDGLTFDQYCLGEGDLEPDSGDPLDLEQPQVITTKPLSQNDQDDRIRMVFGLTSNDPLPDVNDESLCLYNEYLVNNLIFPFEANQRAKYGSPKPLKVIGINDPNESSMIDDEYGILCDAKSNGRLVSVPLSHLNNVTGTPNRQLVNDYNYWIHNFR